MVPDTVGYTSMRQRQDSGVKNMAEIFMERDREMNDWKGMRMVNDERTYMGASCNQKNRK